MNQQVRRTRIVHVVYSFSIGGLENVIVQLINRLPAARFEHVVLSLTTVSNFRERIHVPDVQFIELNKSPGHAVPLYPRIYRLLRSLKPDVVHSCNLAALEIAPLSWLARVPLRVHAEHGWDAHDPQGSNPRYRRLRKIYKPFVSHFVAVSQDIDRYLAQAIGVAPGRHSWIANGVDTDAFAPQDTAPAAVEGCPFDPREHWLIGTVGRLQSVKNQPLLARAFVHLLHAHPELAARARLVVVGDGPLRQKVLDTLGTANMAHLAWLAGARNDIASILPMLDCFVLPSQAEGTSCTLQEAMACGLPVVATAVGGTPELIADGRSGLLVAPDQVETMAAAIWRCYSEPGLARSLGAAARRQALDGFAINTMVQRYRQLFLSHTKGFPEGV